MFSGIEALIPSAFPCSLACAQEVARIPSMYSPVQPSEPLIPPQLGVKALTLDDLLQAQKEISAHNQQLREQTEQLERDTALLRDHSLLLVSARWPGRASWGSATPSRGFRAMLCFCTPRADLKTASCFLVSDGGVFRWGFSAAEVPL